MEPVWLIWDVLFDEAKNRSSIIQKCVEALLDIFTIKYTPSVNKVRRYTIYFAAELLTEPVDFTVPLIDKCYNIPSVIENINMIYKDVKKNEIAPKMLFTPEKQSNLEKTLDKLSIINEISI